MVDAVKRTKSLILPSEITGLWQYYAENDESTCEECKGYDSLVFTAEELLFYFPNLIVITKDKIEPRVHITLWGTDTCRCYLARINNPNL